LNIPGELIQFIRNEKKFIIATHINPDGDGIGSAIALSMALESMGKETTVYDRDPVPETYCFLPGHGRFTSSLQSSHFDKYPLVLMDCNEPARAGLNGISFPRSVVIDHHETEKRFGTIRWIEPHAPATGAMVYSLLKALGVEITPDIATNLYTALAIDTGTFRFSNTKSDILSMAADLVDSGADPASIAQALYESWSGKRFRMLIDVLSTLEIVEDIAMTVASADMFAKAGTSADDTEHFVEFPRMMKGIRVSAFFREIKDGWKVSLRSKGDVNVAEIALGFNGGGHRNAAGFIVKGDLTTAKAALIKAVYGQSNG
jgi:phosphoesterase RecJ-like protein